MSPTFSRKLEETYKRSLNFEHSERVPDSLSVSACSEIFSSTYFNDPSGKIFRGPGDRTNVKERCNKSYPTRSQSFPQLNIFGAQKEVRSLPSDKFEKSQSLHSLLPFLNGRVTAVERNVTGRGLHVQNRPQGCIFSSPTKPEIPKVCKFQMEGSILSVPLPLLRFGTSPKYIHKVGDNSRFSAKKTV